MTIKSVCSNINDNNINEIILLMTNDQYGYYWQQW